MSKDILSVENITMQFGGVVAVNNLSLHIPEGQIVALIGPNGAGKTTAFNCITGVYEPTNGLVKFLDEPMVRNHPTGKMKKLYKGENPLLYTAEYHPEDETKEQMLARDPLAGTGKIVSPTPDRITKLGIARTFQNIRLWKSMTVFENVLVAKHMRARQNVFSATFRGNAREEKRMRDETMALLVEQGLEKYKDDIATSLPYGIQRRLGDRPRAGDGSEAAAARRAGGRHEPAGDARARGVHPRAAREIRPDDLPDRAPYGSGHADLRLHLCH